jgi:hypothetical protein
MDQQVFLDVLGIQLLIHTNEQLLGFGIHIAHIHSPLVVEQHIVPFPGSIDTHIELFRLVDEDSMKQVKTTELGKMGAATSSQERNSIPVVSFLKLGRKHSPRGLVCHLPPGKRDKVTTEPV